MKDFFKVMSAHRISAMINVNYFKLLKLIKYGDVNTLTKEEKQRTSDFCAKFGKELSDFSKSIAVDVEEKEGE